MSAAPQWPQEGFWSLFDLSLMFQSGIERYLESSLDRCAAWFRASGASIFLYDESDQSYRLKAKAGLQSRIPKDAVIRAGEGLAGRVIQLAEAKLIQESYPDLRLESKGDAPEIASSMILPLVEPRQGVVGVLNLSRGGGEPPFTDTDLDQARAMAGQVTLAVANARLVERLNGAIRLSRESRERLEAVLDSAPGGMVVIDGEGILASASPWARKEGLFSGGGKLIHLETAVKELAHRTLMSRSPVGKTVKEQAVDRTFLLQSQPMAIGGAVISVQEITEHERSQREMHRLSRLAEIGQLTAAIAHEFRNPLTGIRSAAQVIQSSPDLAEDMGKIIEEEVLKLNNLCGEFLEFAKPMRLMLEDALLSEPARRVCDLLASDFERGEVELECNFPALEPTILMDVRRIEQVLHNLLRNALQATPPGGKVTVRLNSGGFAVSDTGSGMDEETVKKLFSPFFTTKPSGTGLGLCTVQKIVEAHGGSVQASSKPGAGTTFEVRLKQ